MAIGAVHIQVSNSFFRPASGEVWIVGCIENADIWGALQTKDNGIQFTNGHRFNDPSNIGNAAERHFVTRDNYLQWRSSRSEKVYQSYVQWK